MTQGLKESTGCIASSEGTSPITPFSSPSSLPFFFRFDVSLLLLLLYSARLVLWSTRWHGFLAVLSLLSGFSVLCSSPCVYLRGRVSVLGLLRDPFPTDSILTISEGKEMWCFFASTPIVAPLGKTSDCTHWAKSLLASPSHTRSLGNTFSSPSIVYLLSVFFVFTFIFINLDCSSVIFWLYNACPDISPLVIPTSPATSRPI